MVSMAFLIFYRFYADSDQLVTKAGGPALPQRF
jgi:hypothetical protein